MIVFHQKQTHITALVLSVFCIVLLGCSKEETPEDRRKSVMDVVSRIQLAANKGQIGDLTKMGTGKFEANTFLNHLHQSVEGDCVFTEKRAKVLPMEASILLDVRFGPNGANGHKELNLKFKLEGGWKVSAYKFWDINVPGKPPAEPLPEGKMRDLL